MATFNGARYVEAAVHAVLTQSLSPTEVIVVDDGSSDETPAILRRFGQAITVITQANAGHSAARNAGLSVARGDYVALMDHDDVCSPDRFDRQWAALNDKPGSVSCFCGYWLFNEQGQYDQRPADPAAGGRPPIDYLSEVLVHYPTAFFDRRRARDCRFPLGIHAGEDLIFAAMLAARGPVVVIPDVLYGYRTHATQLSNANQATASTNRYFDDRHGWVKAHWREWWPEQSWDAIEAALWQGLVRQTEAAYWARNARFFLHDRDYIRKCWPAHLPRPAVASWRWYPDWVWDAKGVIDRLRG